MRQCTRDIWQTLPNQLPYAKFMNGICYGPQKANADRFNLLLGERIEDLIHRGLMKRVNDFAACTDPFGHFVSEPAWNVWVGVTTPMIKWVGSAALAEAETHRVTWRRSACAAAPDAQVRRGGADVQFR